MVTEKHGIPCDGCEFLIEICEESQLINKDEFEIICGHKKAIRNARGVHIAVYVDGKCKFK